MRSGVYLKLAWLNAQSVSLPNTWGASAARGSSTSFDAYMTGWASRPARTENRRRMREALSPLYRNHHSRMRITARGVPKMPIGAARGIARLLQYRRLLGGGKVATCEKSGRERSDLPGGDRLKETKLGASADWLSVHVGGGWDVELPLLSVRIGCLMPCTCCALGRKV